MSNVGKQTQELPMVPGRVSGGVSMAGAASNKMATLTPGSIAPGAASAFDSENATSVPVDCVLFKNILLRLIIIIIIIILIQCFPHCVWKRKNKISARNQPPCVLAVPTML